MADNDLFTGIAVLIDDEIGDAKANINVIIEQIQQKKIPYLSFTELPEEDAIAHFGGVSFILLDWKLQSPELAEQITEGVKTPGTLGGDLIQNNIDFLKELKKKCFAPIFIFTNEKIDEVITILKTNGLYEEGKPNYIFVKSKNDLGQTKLFSEIESWVNKTASVYVLKEWGREYQKAKNELFWNFYDLSPSWPQILWNNYGEDGVNKSGELGEIITRNLYTRMAPFNFDDNILKYDAGHPRNKEELRKVLEGERFIKGEKLVADTISVGDVFTRDEGGVYLNIRPECDCVADRNKAGASIDDVELYLLVGTKINIENEKKIFANDHGHFPEIDSQAIVFSMLNGETFDFRFKKLSNKFKWKDIKNKRIGRLLPPYITRIQQRYALYLQRQGLPRIPLLAVHDEPIN